MKISVSSYSFHQYINAGKMKQADVIETADKIGFSCVEFTDIEGKNFDVQEENAKKIREKADSLGMEITAYTIFADFLKDDVRAETERVKKQLHIAKILGAPVMRHDAFWSLSPAARSFELALSKISPAIREVSEYAETLGIRTCTENHGFIAQDSYRMEALFNAVNHRNYGLLIDMGNFVCADEDSASAVSRLAPYAFYVHAKDMLIKDASESGIFTRGGNKFEGTVIGEGNIPIERNLRILKLAGYDGTVSIEYEGSMDCIDGVTKGFNNLKKFIENAERQIK